MTGAKKAFRKSAMSQVETPSGKGAADENFPVGSWLLPKPLRPHVAAYYAFARAIDDIADNGALAPEVKILRLDAFDHALTSDAGAGSPAFEKARALKRTMDATGIPTKHGSDLISAFKQDAVKLRYDTWDELIDYCDRSASPVGRFLCDLHGEDRALYPLSDALCNALQVINHLQDCGDDFPTLNRVYLPQEWMRVENAVTEDLSKKTLTPELRRVVDRCLDGTERLMEDARRLPKAMKHRQLAAETAVIVSIADKLIVRLRKHDPLATRVVLSKAAAATAAVRGLWTYWL